MTDKPKPLKVEEKEVEPVKMPRGKVVTKPQDDPPREPDEGTSTPPPTIPVPETPEEPDTRPRAERRRSHKEKVKLEKEQRNAAKKYMQQMAKPIRFRDIGLVVNQVFTQFQPIFGRIQDELDKLGYLPDYIADVLDPEEGRECSIADFEEWFKKLKEELEAEEQAKLEAEDTSEEEAPEDVSPPETEEAQ